jgi:hypothetical protein
MARIVVPEGVTLTSFLDRNRAAFEREVVVTPNVLR